jgi:hypothetical protein
MRNKIRIFVLGAALAMSAAAAAADWNVKSVERSLETNTANLQLPDSTSGELGIVQCDTCRRIALRFTEHTQITVGKASVTLAELKEFLSTAGHEHFAMVFYGLKDTDVLRLAVKGELNRPRQNR